MSTANVPGRNFWVGVVSRSHVLLGVKGGFAQLNHGKRAPLTRFKAGDGLIFYSPRVEYPDGEPLQAFTAIGRVKTGEVYKFDMGGGFVPFRIDVKFLKAKEAPIRPLIEPLGFIRDKTHWGAAFRFGYVKVLEPDFRRIAAAMACDFDKHFRV